MEKKLLIINPGQFGYKAGYYYYCKYLRNDFDITFLCCDRELDKLKIDGVNVKYVSFEGNKIRRYCRWLNAVIKEALEGDYDIIFLVYFKLCFIIGLLFKTKKIILDIRTGSIKQNRIKNYLQNIQLKFESFFFRTITILSKELVSVIGLNKKKCHLLPLGSEFLSLHNKNFQELNLLYVGTFNSRRIHETIVGLKLFLENNSEFKEKISYNIFGFGSEDELHLIHKTIEVNYLKDVVKFHGRKNHKELQYYFDNCNIGISYVPMTDYYDYQPPTKTFESILSGMVCIATKTYENSKLINNRNGVLCDDTPESFARALEQVYNRRDTFHSEQIRNTLKNFTWENIVEKNLKIFLKEVVND